MIYNQHQLRELIERVAGGISSVRVTCDNAPDAERTRQALYRQARLLGCKIRIEFEPPQHLILSPLEKIRYEPL